MIIKGLGIGINFQIDIRKVMVWLHRFICLTPLLMYVWKGKKCKLYHIICALCDYDALMYFINVWFCCPSIQQTKKTRKAWNNSIMVHFNGQLTIVCFWISFSCGFSKASVLTCDFQVIKQLFLPDDLTGHCVFAGVYNILFNCIFITSPYLVCFIYGLAIWKRLSGIGISDHNFAVS